MQEPAESAESDYENSWFIFMFIVALSGKNCGRRIKQTTRYSIRRRIFAKHKPAIYISNTLSNFTHSYPASQSYSHIHENQSSSWIPKKIFSFFFLGVSRIVVDVLLEFQFSSHSKNWKAKRLKKAIMDRQINNNTMDGISRNTSRVLAPPGGRS